MVGHKGWNRIGVADSGRLAKGRERAYAGLQRVHTKALKLME